MTSNRLMAGASRFAHFAGLARASRAAEDDDDRQDGDEPKGKGGRKAEDDDQDDGDEPKGKRGRKAEDDDQDDGDEPKGKGGRKAEDDDLDDDDGPKGKRGRKAEDDDQDDGDDEPKGKRSRRAADDDDDGDDDDKEEMNGRSAKAQARLREQQRIAAILGHKSAANNLALAVSLACETRMSRREAIAVMRSQPAGGNQSREDRSDRAGRNVHLGSDAPVTGTQAVAASWGRAFDKAGVQLRKN